MNKENGKKAIVILLFLSCIVSGIILAAGPSEKIQKVNTFKELDSLITGHIFDSQINAPQVRINDYRADSGFVRRDYRVRVPTRFSKTLFHLDLHHTLNSHGLKVPAKVHFPERDMDVYVLKNGTVLRTIRLVSDSRLDTAIIGAMQ